MRETFILGNRRSFASTEARRFQSLRYQRLRVYATSAFLQEHAECHERIAVRSPPVVHDFSGPPARSDTGRVRTGGLHKHSSGGVNFGATETLVGDTACGGSSIPILVGRICLR